MDHETRAPSTQTRFRVTLAGNGRPGPIEQRIGRRLLRLIDPESDEGQRLLENRRVDWIGPDGDNLGPLALDEAYRRLILRLESRLADPRAGDDCRALQEGVNQIRAWSERIGRS